MLMPHALAHPAAVRVRRPRPGDVPLRVFTAVTILASLLVARWIARLMEDSLLGIVMGGLTALVIVSLRPIFVKNTAR